MALYVDRIDLAQDSVNIVILQKGISFKMWSSDL